MKTSTGSFVCGIRAFPILGMLALLVASAVCPVAAIAASSSLAITITNPTPAAFDYFGNSVAVAGGGKVLIGAPSDDVGGVINAGSAYIYSSNGVRLATITNPASTYNAWFGNSVAGVGSNYVIVGAHRNDSGATDAGAVHIFNPNGILLATITNPAPEANDYFGYSVAGVGVDTLVVGVPFDDAGLPDVGSAFFFDVTGALLAAITNPAPTVNDYFGNSVAGVGGDRIVVGAYGADVGAENAGIAYVFDNAGVLLATITNPTPATDDDFGYCVAGVGTNMIVVGAHKDDTGAINAGIAYIFDVGGKLLATLTNPNPEINDWFGFSVASAGPDRVIVGAQLDNTGATDSGIAYLFDTKGVLLATIRNPTPRTGDSFGYSVAGLSSNRVIVGSYMADSGAQDSGLVHIFGINTTLLTDYDGDGISDMSVYNDVDHDWSIRTVASNVLASALAWGYGDVAAVPGDYDGDSVADLAVFDDKSGDWYIRTLTGDVIAWAMNWGYTGVVAVAGDYDGDSVSDLAVFDEQTGDWYIRKLSGDVIALKVNWGYPGVVPVSGDYDGDSISDLAVFDDRTGDWYIRTVEGDVIAEGVNWGFPGVVPVPGDYDGDGLSDLAVFNEKTGNWYIRRLNGDVITAARNWGYPGVVPVPGDYNGDGRYDLAVYYPPTGKWHIEQLGIGPSTVLLFGPVWGGQPGMPVGGVW
ncbi:MAG TPA: FG-GAP-like repeat-containing protein [Kiritimatiellia bacterium]|nr:FG-GAP-like repeat-containing protein [Kiritimatiellia bacterium]